MIKKYPFYVRSTVVLFGLVLFVYCLLYLREVLVPLSFSFMLAVLLNPLNNLFQKWKLPKVPAIIACLLIATLVFALVGYFLFSQMQSFSNELPQLKKKGIELLSNFQHELANRFGIDTRKQNQMLSEAETGLKPLIGSTVGALAGSLAMALLLPVYTFLLLFYKTLLLDFLYEVFDRENSKEVAIVLKQTKTAVQSYMFGLLVEGLIVATLNSIALLLLGVKYAILLGVLGAVVNVLPFIGGILAILFPLIIATVTKDGFQTQIGIILANALIQFVDNHFLIPYIVSSRVKINALVSIVIVLLGGMLWGIPGMFLSIPFTGVLKIICDRVPDLKPWGKLLGTDEPTRKKTQLNPRAKKKAVVKA